MEVGAASASRLPKKLPPAPFRSRCAGDTVARARPGAGKEAEGAEAVGRRTYLSSKRRLGRLGSDIRGRAIDKKGTTPEAQGIRHAKLFDDNAAVEASPGPPRRPAAGCPRRASLEASGRYPMRAGRAATHSMLRALRRIPTLSLRHDAANVRPDGDEVTARTDPWWAAAFAELRPDIERFVGRRLPPASVQDVLSTVLEQLVEKSKTFSASHPTWLSTTGEPPPGEAAAFAPVSYGQSRE